MRSVVRSAVTSVFVLLLATVCSDADAQTTTINPPPVSTPEVRQVTVDLRAGAFDRDLPFDVPFFIAGVAPEGVRGLQVQYAVIPVSGDISNLAWAPSEGLRWTPDGPTVGSQPFLVLVRTPLDATRQYAFRFVFLRDTATGSTTLTAQGRTSARNYVSLDAGVVYAGTIGIGAVYVGSNIYFRPINKDASPGSLTDLGRRLALTVGVTVSSIADEDNQTRSDLFWNQSLILGAGYRLTSSLRGGGGALVFREADPNPLITRKSAAVTWYTSFSFDLDVARWW